MSTVATLLAKLELDTSGFQKGLAAIPNQLGSVGSSISQIGGSITRGVTLPVLAGAAATIALGANAIQTGADYEKAMSGVSAILGATADQQKALSDEGIRLGMDPDLVVTAGEAAGVMEELAKNGATVEQILGGAAEGAIALANATGTDFASAANIAATSMALFNIPAEEMKRVIDQVTAVANTSRFDAEDYAQAIGMGGAAAKSAGVEYEEFTAVIAALSNYTSSGSDAGTSFKTFITRLAPSTAPAIETMTELGIITEEAGNRFFDAEGNMKSMGEIAGILQETMSGLTQEERILAMHDIFGTDAQRAAIALMETGEQGFADLMGTMAKTDAAANAATRMDNLAGSMEILGGISEGFKIKFAQAVGPGVRTAIESFSTFLSSNSKEIEHLFVFLAATIDQFGQSFGPWLDQNGPKMIEFFEKIIASLPAFIEQMSAIGEQVAPKVQILFDAFMNADPATIANIMQAIGTLALLGPVLSAVGGFIVTLSSVITLVGGAWGAISGLLSGIATVAGYIGAAITGGIVLPLLVIIGTLGLVVYAFATNFMGITTTVQQLGYIIGYTFVTAGNTIVTAWTTFTTFIKNKFTEISTTVKQLDAIFQFIRVSISNAIQQVINKVLELARSLLKIKLPAVLTPGSPTPFEMGLRGIASAMQDINRTGLSGLETSPTSPVIPAMASLNSNSSTSGAPAIGSSKNVVVNITNPKKEAAEDSIRKSLKNLNYLGVLE